MKKKDEQLDVGFFVVWFQSWTREVEEIHSHLVSLEVWACETWDKSGMVYAVEQIRVSVVRWSNSLANNS